MPRHPDYPAPFEFVELQLCRDVYHCTRSQLDNEDWVDIAADLEMMKVEAEIAKLKPPSTGGKTFG